jgi:uncharacterized RDD family membrane protein YckC
MKKRGNTIMDDSRWSNQKELDALDGDQVFLEESHSHPMALNNEEIDQLEDLSSKEYTIMKLASPFQRFLAKIINVVLLIAIYVLTKIDVTSPLEKASNQFALFLFLVGVFLFVQTLLLSLRGQSVGKLILGLKIVRENDGGNGGFRQNVLFRTILTTALMSIPILRLVDIIMIFGVNRKCLHDWYSDTVVVDLHHGRQKVLENELKDMRMVQKNPYFLEGKRIYFDAERTSKISGLMTVVVSTIVVGLLWFLRTFLFRFYGRRACERLCV